MTVKELIKMLAKQDDDAIILIRINYFTDTGKQILNQKRNGKSVVILSSKKME